MGVHQIESNVKKLKSANEKLTTLSQIDQLTGIYNRGTFETKFREMLSVASEKKSTICVFIADLDNFKDFNDGYGHLKGDEVIKTQANILTQVFHHTTDLVARYRGEEFIVATTTNSHENCRALAKK